MAAAAPIRTGFFGTSRSGRAVVVGIGVLVASIGALGKAAMRPPAHAALIAPVPDPPSSYEVEASVSDVAWKHITEISRRQVIQKSGFAETKPADAFDVKVVEKRIHHYEKVVDRVDTEYYEEREQQGYDTESYTERVACGQDCRETSSGSCREVCKPNSNGFATCKTECSSPQQTCSTRYCDERRTRQTPRYVQVRKSRQVPKYRDDPRMMDWITYSVWEWKLDRTLVNEGKTLPVSWPGEAQMHLNKGLKPGESEKAEQKAEYDVTLREDGGYEHRYRLGPNDVLAEYALGDRIRLRVRRSGPIQVLGRAAKAGN